MADSHTIDILLNGQVVSASPGETVLSVAKRNDINVPSLCHHQALLPSGACRLCVVEISKEKGLDEKRDVVAACQYPVSEGLIVQTNSERVRRHRRVVISLILARAPEVKAFQEMAKSLGGAIAYRESERKDNCILCTLCTRTCQAIGAEAISPSGRGYDKEIAPPFLFGEGGCVGCGACHRVCPTGCIEMVDTKDSRTIWEHEFPFVKCRVCGAPTVTEAFMAFAAGRSGLREDYFTICSSCKRKETAKTFAELSAPLDGRSEP